jgi:hypothetical protein
MIQYEPLVFAHPQIGALRVEHVLSYPVLDEHVFKLQITEQGNVNTSGPVSAGGTGRILSSGRVQVGGSAVRTVHRLTGDTALTQGGAQSGWNYMAYGWMLQNHANQWLVLDANEGEGAYRYVGCFRDQRNDRAMEGNMRSLPAPGNAQVAYLSRHAAYLGKRLFSVQAGNDKWLSESDDLGRVTRHGRLEDTECSSVDALGSNTGGPLALALYENTPRFLEWQRKHVQTSFGTITHVGCFQDGQPRIMTGGSWRMGDDRDTRVEQAMMLARHHPASIQCWQTGGYFLFGIESETEVYIPSQWEVANDLWQSRGARLSCDAVDRYNRPLGGDWIMSVYRVDQNDTYRRLS